MRVGWRLALADLKLRRALAASLVLLIAVPLFAALLLDGYARAIAQIQRRIRPYLVVQAANTAGEIAGSRLSPSVLDELQDRGVTDAVPEIHAITGERIDRGVLLRGVDLERYRDVEVFDLLAGTALAPESPARQVMIGESLAQRRDLGVDDALTIRGRRFTVVGVFGIGTFADNEAWVSLPDAQEVLGWGEDVSLYVVPDDGTLRVGDRLPGAVSVARRGDVDVFAHEWLPLLDLVGLAAWALEIGAAVMLAVVLWRLAWLRRRELGLFRLLGLRFASPSYLIASGASIALTSAVVAVVLAMVVSRAIATETLGVPVETHVDLVVVLRTLAVGLGVLVVAVALPVIVFQRRRPTVLLQRN